MIKLVKYIVPGIKFAKIKTLKGYLGFAFFYHVIILFGFIIAQIDYYMDIAGITVPIYIYLLIMLVINFIFVTIDEQKINLLRSVICSLIPILVLQGYLLIYNLIMG